MNKIFRGLQRSRSMRVLLLSSIVSIFALIGICISVQSSSNKKDSMLNAVAGLCTGFITSSVVVAIGVNSITEHMDKIKQETDLYELENFWKNNRSLKKDKNSQLSTKYTILIISNKGGVSCNQKGVRESNAFEVGHRIYKALGMVCNNKEQIHLFFADDEDELKPELLHQDNLIILGQGSESKIIKSFCEKLQIPYYQRGEDGAATEISAKMGLGAKYGSDISNPEEDVCVVTRVTSGERLLILFNSNKNLGVLGAVNLLTNPEKIEHTGFGKLTSSDNNGMSLVLGISKNKLEESTSVEISKRAEIYSALAPLENVQGVKIKIHQQFDAFSSSHIQTVVNDICSISARKKQVFTAGTPSSPFEQ
jgi:hypothetical protein